MAQVKICGLTRPEDIEAVNRERPDYCGFILYFPKSRRNISAETLRELRKMLDPGIRAVGVFVDQPPQVIADLLREGAIDIAQLHGKEDPAYIKELKTLTDRPVWQAVQVRCREDLKRAEESPADLVLLDAGQGSGQTFDWQYLKELARPFALAGGLTPENIEDAMRTGAALYDVSGGVETGGLKDESKVRALIRAVRSQHNDAECGCAGKERDI